MARSIHNISAVAAIFLGGYLLSLLCTTASAFRNVGTVTNNHNMSATSLGDVIDTGVLYLYWPGTFCTCLRKCCRPTSGYVAEDSFLVSELVYYSSRTGSECYNFPPCDSFDLNAIEDVVPSLNVYWPNLGCPAKNGTTLWRFSWCRFGSCGELKEEDYFTNALRTAVAYNPYKPLKEANIVPSGTYDLESIKTALRKKLAFAYNIDCYPTKTDTLYGINICVTSDGKTPVPCRGKFLKTNCQSTVKYPAAFDANRVHGTEIIKLPTDH